MCECVNVLTCQSLNLFFYLFDAAFYEVVAVFRVAEAVAASHIATVVHTVGQQFLIVGQQLSEPLQLLVVMNVTHSIIITQTEGK